MVFGCTGLEIKAEDFGKGIEGLKGTCRVEVEGLTRRCKHELVVLELFWTVTSRADHADPFEQTIPHSELTTFTDPCSPALIWIIPNCLVGMEVVALKSCCTSPNEQRSKPSSGKPISEWQ